jgi:hypothetical protein
MSRFFISIFFIFFFYNNIEAQKDEIDEKMRIKDSIRSEKTKNAYSGNVVSSEIHNLLFRNIYRRSNYNEEVEFEKKRQHLLPFEDLKIDTIIIKQFKVFGENIYDTSQKASGLEKFLSEKLHVTTSQKLIQNRFLFFKSGDYFSSYRALENARLIRNSNIFHDVRFVPILNQNGNIDLYLYIQDVLPYDFEFGFNSFSNFNFGVSNFNIFGTGHQLRTKFIINQNDTKQKFGSGYYYTIPNIFKKSFIDLNAHYYNFRDDQSVQLSLSREFARPEFRWAGGVFSSFKNQDFYNFTLGSSFNINKVKNEVWISHAIPFKTIKKFTQNALVLGINFNQDIYTKRNQDVRNLPDFWNQTGFLSSIGYARIKYVQDRLLNGFGRTEDVPTGFSTNLIYGLSNTEFGKTTYYGFQILGQFYNKNNNYLNLGAKLGINEFENQATRGVLDLNIQLTSSVISLGKLRIRNYLNSRYTLGINQDDYNFINFNEFDGIRGLSNGAIRGQDRFAMSLQNNIYFPFSLIGFRTYFFSLFEIARMRQNNKSIYEGPVYSGASFGFAFRNENMVFDLIQIQYGFYPSTTGQFIQKGIVISSVIPFRFQGLDISRPQKVIYR